MLRVKAGLIAITVSAAVFAAFTAAPAFGAFSLGEVKCEGGTVIAFCWAKEATSPLFELSGEEPFEGLIESGTVASTRFKVLGETFETLCTGATIRGTIAQTEPLAKNYSTSNIIFFTECKLAGAIGEKCKISKTLESKALTGTPLTAESVDFKAREGEIVLEVTFEELSGCPGTLKGAKFKIKGTQLCEWQEANFVQESKLLVCDPKSELSSQFGAVELETTFVVKLTNIAPDLWSVVEVS